MKAHIQAIEYHLPEQVLRNEQLCVTFPDWNPQKIESKTGIRERRIAAPGECASDLAVTAATKLFEGGACDRAEIDYLLVCTQSPDYLLPTTACLIQARLGLPQRCGALDFNLGCSGFVYGLGLAKGLIETGQARKVLLLTAETYSKFLHVQDRSVRALFGDGAAAVLLAGAETEEEHIGPFVFGTDGNGANHLIVPAGGMRQRAADPTKDAEIAGMTGRTTGNLFMNGPEIFNFTLRVVPETVGRLLESSGRSAASIDWWVFHQANRYMLDHLRKKIGIPTERFVIEMAECGNTVSSTIPIALKRLEQSGQLVPGQSLMLVGFGVGYSWGGALIEWHQTR